jgi:hypothetical protein
MAGSNPAVVVKQFQATLENAANTAKRIAATGEQLMPALFFIDKDGGVTISGLIGDVQPYDPVGKAAVRMLVEQFDATAVVYVGEVAVTTLDKNDVPDDMSDGILVVGFYKGLFTGTQFSVGKMWSLDGERRAHEVRDYEIPSNLTDWMPEVFA